MESFDYLLLVQIIKWLKEKEKFYSKIEKPVNGIAFDYPQNNNKIYCHIDNWQWLNTDGYKHHPDNDPKFYNYFIEIVQYNLNSLLQVISLDYNVPEKIQINFYLKEQIVALHIIDDIKLISKKSYV